MRRPVCLFGLAFAVIWSLLLSVIPGQTAAYEMLDKQRITIAGVVESKEYKLQNQKEILVVSVKQVCVLQPEKVSYLQQILSKSDRDSETIKIWKQYVKQSRGSGLQEGNVRKQNGKESLEEGAWTQNGNDMLQEEVSGSTGNDTAMNQERDRALQASSITGVLCYMEKGQEPAIGSLVIISGKFRAFCHATNPGEFDSADYYQINRIQGRLMQGALEYESPSDHALGEKLYQCRIYLGLLLDAVYPADKATIMRAMLLGEKGVLDADVKALYQQNGIIHILAISGLHLSILGMGLYKLLHKCYVPQIVNVPVSIAFMFGYGMMTGMGVSLRRALIMFAVHLGAVLCGRTYDMLTAMSVAAVTILLTQPWYLTHSGFLFSFCAICGIGILLPAMEQNRVWDRKWISAVVSNVGISISTLPVYLGFYYEIPPYSVLLNLLVVPCMTVIMVSGVGTLLLSALFLPLGHITAIPGTMLLTLYEKCCELCKRLPNHTWITGCPQKWQIICFVLILAVVIMANKYLTKIQFWQGILVALMVLTLRFYDGLEITMVDVGQGDCIYVTDGRTHILIDGGSSDKQAVASYQILPFLKYRGVARLDAMFVTHPDSDHENGILEILDNYEDNGITIDVLLLPDIEESCQNEDYRKLRQLAEEAGIDVQTIKQGDCFGRTKGMLLTCLHPPEQYLNQDTNACSTVLYLQYGNFTALFTGDLEGDGEILLLEELRRRQIQKMDLLKVAHHGSRNSSTREFLNLLQPQIALLSAGRDNSYGHPHSETLERLATCGAHYFCTQDYGAVTVKVTRHGKIQVEGYVSVR